MTTDTMSLERFSELLDSRGATLHSWPAEEREAAERLLAASPQAAARLDEARALDEALRSAQPRAKAGLADRIVQASGAGAQPSDKK